MVIGVAFVGFVLIAAALKLRQERLPRSIYRLVAAAVIAVPIVATAYALWRLANGRVTVRELVLFAVFYIATGVGTSVGLHRLLTHRSFETGRIVTAFLLCLGSMANQGRCIDWAAHHRKHHAHSDRDGDPHSPLDGFVHAHVGWIFRGDEADRERYCNDLLKDRVVQLVDATTPAWVLLGLFLPYAVAGWQGLLWGGLVRMAFITHVTFAVNSVGHRFGSRLFATRDRSRNNFALALVSFGEGWHNNHHAFPSMAYFGMSRRQVDLGALVIRSLVRLGLASNVKQPSARAIDLRRLEPAEPIAPSRVQAAGARHT